MSFIFIFDTFFYHIPKIDQKSVRELGEHVYKG